MVVEHSTLHLMPMFEPIVRAVATIAPRVEVLEPGTCAVPTVGPSRYFGGDEALVVHVQSLVDEALRDRGLVVRCTAGVADGMFAARLAARAGLVVPRGGSQAFLEPQPVVTLRAPELVDLLQRLGLRTLGGFAALPASDVSARFGVQGALAHRLARGLDVEPFVGGAVPEEVLVEASLEPPVQRMDQVAFVAKSLADRLQERLRSLGLACHQLRIEVETEHGEVLSRSWRHDGRLGAGAITERVRWQLEGWLGGSEDDGFEPTGGLTMLRLTPEGLMADSGLQLGFWGGAAAVDERVDRALARVQGMVGERGVLTAVLGGGRRTGAQVRLVPWGSAREPALPGLPIGVGPPAFDALPAGIEGKREVPIWPGQIPPPYPATVYPEPLPADLLDATGATVSVSGRGAVSGAPARLVVREGGRSWHVDLDGWTGPWLLDERWWDDAEHRRSATMQVSAGTGAWLVVRRDEAWGVEARYD